ncbi:MAG TPA: YjbH domain-containing protein, partial [Burkholderiales bacterium]|nr:YjbH domain-containing protein [Burkholderiales bacterium]
GAVLALIAALGWAGPVWPQAASTTGQTGLINMPDARVAPDGTLRFGYSYADPYATIWTSITFLPRIELSGRVTRVLRVPEPTFGDTYGDFKDKAIDGKLVLVEEGKWWPQFTLGGQDFIGTRVFPAWYAVASKRLGDFDFTVGYGGDRIDGVFGGVRYRPSALPNWALVAEYDANNYPQDFGAAMSGAANLKKSPGVGIEYTWGWLTGQVAYTREKAAAMGYISIPLAQKDFIPKYNEPLPYTKITPRPTREQWLESDEHRQRMAQALAEQDFRNIRISYVHDRVEVVLTNSRISLVSRAVGRAARTILLLSPISAREIRITYTVRELPIVTYSFPDLDRLQRYFNGMVPRWELAQHVAITYAAPGADTEATDVTGMLGAFEEHQAGVKVLYQQEDGDFIQLKSEDLLLNQFRVRPSAAVYLNDPSGAFKYEIGVQASLDHRLARRTFFSAAVNYNIFETVSDVTQPSNSLLPHVRSDIAEYKKASPFKLTRLLINQLYQPAERVYARASAGYYEEMFAGAGGQVLYLPVGAGWATDLAVDWVAQRNHEGLGFSFYDYQTVTAIGSFHYRLPMGMTATARAGRFLAKDEGVRFELKRRFASGWEVGAWYTRTNGNDITSPGSPGHPYYDKGLFMTIPLNLLLTRDTQATAPMSISPWTRDVGAMVVSPLDLYRLMEKPLVLDVHDQDGLVMFGDVDDNYNRSPELGSPVRSPRANQP